MHNLMSMILMSESDAAESADPFSNDILPGATRYRLSLVMCR